MKRNSILGLILILVLFVGVGCELTEVKQDAQGNPQTQIESILNEVSEGIKGVAPVANMAFPGGGLAATGIALLLSLIGNGITSVVVKKRGTALSTVIAGIEEGTKNYEEAVNAIVDIVRPIDPMAAEKVKAEAMKYTNIKELIAGVSKIVGNDKYIHNYVQSVTKKAA